MASETLSGGEMKRLLKAMGGLALLALLASGAAAQDRPDPEKGDQPDPKLIVPPVQEPDVALDGDVEKRPGVVAVLPGGGGYLFERKDEAGKKMAGVVVPGIVLVTRGMVELFGCGLGGKEHETVMRLECDVQALDLALTSASFKRGRLPTDPRKELPLGSRVVILVQWTGPDGKTVTHRSEDLVVSLRRHAPMPRVGWTYVAQWAEVLDPTDPKGLRRHRQLAAANTQSYVATFRDRSALLDNPLEEAVDDTVYAANWMVLPKPGTPVRVIFRTPTTDELVEIEALEKIIAKEARDFRADDRPDKEPQPK
jgi:hypothetical protein